MMLYKKVYGLFCGLPLESIHIDMICKYTNSTKEEIQPILDKLKEEGNISGKRKYKLAGDKLKKFNSYTLG